jgi:hypothetical protein
VCESVSSPVRSRACSAAAVGQWSARPCQGRVPGCGAPILKVYRVLGRWLVGVVCVITSRAEVAAMTGSRSSSRWLSASHGSWAAWRNAPQLLKPLSSIVISTQCCEQQSSPRYRSKRLHGVQLLFIFYLEFVVRERDQCFGSGCANRDMHIFCM